MDNAELDMDEINSLLSKALNLDTLDLIHSKKYAEKINQEYALFAAVEKETLRIMDTLNLEVSSAFKSPAVHLFRMCITDNFVNKLSDYQIACLLKNKLIAKSFFWRSDIIDEMITVQLRNKSIRKRGIKPIIKLVKSMAYAKILTPGRIYEKLRDLGLLFNEDFNKNYIDVVNTFCVDDKVKMIFFKNMHDLADRLSSACKGKLNIFGLWNETQPSTQWPLVDYSLQHNLPQLKSILAYGSKNSYSEKQCLQFKMWLKKNGNLWSNFINVNVLFETGNPSKYRCLQILCIYTYSKVDHLKRACAIEAANYLWRSIKDAYLTEKEFKTCFDRRNPMIRCELRCAWKWYKKHVLNRQQKKIKSPRSLLHLSRCAIRTFLTKTYNLPTGVKQLDLPVTLTNYLLLNE